MQEINFRHPKGYINYVQKFNKFKLYIAKTYNATVNLVIPTCGATGALHAIFSSLASEEYKLNKKPTALLFSPEYYDAFVMLKDLGYSIKTIESLNSNKIDSMITSIEEKPTVVYISNPNNPLGTILDELTIIKIVSAIKEETTLVIDKTLISKGLLPNMGKIYNRFKDKNLIIVDSYSKSSGLIEERVGYLITTKEEKSNLIHKYAHAPSLNSIMKAMKNTNKEYKKNSLKNIEKSDKILIELTRNTKIKYYPSKSNFALLEITNRINSEEIKEKLKAKGIIVVSSRELNLREEKFIRISMELPKKLPKLIKEIKKIV